MTEEERLEMVAELCHEQWSNWMRHLFGRGTWNEHDSFTIHWPSAARWKRQAGTPYAMLSEEEKESDRKEARKFLECIGLTFAGYEEKAMRTADKNMTLGYAALGLGESGEVQNDVKHIIGHGYTLEEMIPRITEELGDLLWYIAAVCSMCGIPMEMMAGHNVDTKLVARYPDGFVKKGERKDESQ